jgi:predicted dehydrogenase
VLSELSSKEGLCDFVGFVDKRRCEELAEKYDIKYFKGVGEILPIVDAIFVVTPTDIHYEIVRRCLLEDKHVFVEKPLTLNSVEAMELVKIAEMRRCILAVGYQYRFNPVVIRLKEVIKEIGNIHYITMRYIHSSKPPRKDMGVIFNFGSHLIDILNFSLNKLPERIFCKKVNYFSKEREDFASILLDYGDFVASLEVSWLHPLKKRLNIL